MRTITAAAVLIVVLLGGDLVSAAEPTRGNWRWPAALAKVNEQAAAAAAGCVVWVEAYDVSSYRSWVRCGVAATASGFQREEIFFGGWSGATPKTGSDTLLMPPGSGFCNFGSGFAPSVCNSGPITGGGVDVVTGFDITFDTPDTAGALGHASGPGKESYYRHVSSCTGAALAGSIAAGPFVFPGVTFHFGVGSTKTRGANTGVIGPQCRGADVLGTDFGPIASDCSAGLTVQARLRGSLKTVGDCSCIPRGQAIVNGGYFPPNTCVFVPITGDPGGIGTSDGSPGDRVNTPGHSFTNQDLAALPEGKIPTSGGAGFPDGSGVGTTAGGTSPSGGPAGGGTGLGGSGTGSGSGPGGNCVPSSTDPLCDGSPVPDTAGLPGVPELDAGLIIPPESEYPQDWKALITNFLLGNPLVAALTGTTITASGTCDATANVMGVAVGLGFSLIPEIIWTVWGGFVVLTTHVAGFLYLFRG